MSDSGRTDSDTTLTPNNPITDLPGLEGTSLSPPEQSISTPFSSPALDRFEYPFPISQALLAATSDSSTQALPNGSIVPRSDTGRGMDMSSFGSFVQPAQTEALPYPSATASASQVPERTVPLADAAGGGYNHHHHHHHYSAGELCTIASANSPIPPSLVLKRQKLSVAAAAAAAARKRVSNDLEMEGAPKV